MNVDQLEELARSAVYVSALSPQAKELARIVITEASWNADRQNDLCAIAVLEVIHNYAVNRK